MKKITILLAVLLIFVTFSCTPNKGENLNDITKAHTVEKPSTFSIDESEKGINMPELKTFLKKDEIENVAETMVNKPGTTQDQLDLAVILLNRMKKEDYEKTWLLYLEKDIEYQNIKYEGAEHVVKNLGSQIFLYKKIFEYANKYEVSFVRLPEETQRELFLLALKELEKSSAIYREDGSYCGQTTTCSNICMTQTVYPLPDDVEEEEWYYATSALSTFK